MDRSVEDYKVSTKLVWLEKKLSANWISVKPPTNISTG